MATQFVDSEASVPPEEKSSFVSVPTGSEAKSEKPKESESSGSSPGRFGTYMSFLLVFVGIILSIIVFSQAKNISLDSFEDGCPDSYMEACKAVAGVMRVSMALTIVFGLQGLMTLVSAQLFDSLWQIKLFGFVALVVGFFFASSEVFGTDGYAWFARITGFLYLILQQIILLDLAYTWNERWVDYATNSEGERGKKWLYGLLAFSCIFFAGAFVVFGLLYWQFSNCDNNIVIITLAMGFCIIASATQMFFSNEGSVLTSSIMTAYSSYITYSAVILNPNDSCNPTLHTDYQTLSAVSTKLSFSYLLFSLFFYSAVSEMRECLFAILLTGCAFECLRLHRSLVWA